MQQRLNWKWRVVSNIPKYWSYKIRQRVWINDKCAFFYPHAVGKVGEIVELLEQGGVDYGVRTSDNSWYRLKENEVDIIPDGVWTNEK
jgi:hypothetical protein